MFYLAISSLQENKKATGRTHSAEWDIQTLQKDAKTKMKEIELRNRSEKKSWGGPSPRYSPPASSSAPSSQHYLSTSESGAGHGLRPHPLSSPQPGGQYFSHGAWMNVPSLEEGDENGHYDSESGSHGDDEEKHNSTQENDGDNVSQSSTNTMNRNKSRRLSEPVSLDDDDIIVTLRHDHSLPASQTDLRAQGSKTPNFSLTGRNDAAVSASETPLSARSLPSMDENGVTTGVPWYGVKQRSKRRNNKPPLLSRPFFTRTIDPQHPRFNRSQSVSIPSTAEGLSLEELRRQTEEDFVVSHDNKIVLNVGGELFVTSRSTINRDTSSMLSSMISG